ncbi:MAG: NADH-quinone oxidoreductase subunit C [Nitrosopumilaceae archaeon]|nr:NADH-quinone oxidoreductase subunit C [Nitrosopumilaceae archaeon]
MKDEKPATAAKPAAAKPAAAAAKPPAPAKPAAAKPAAARPSPAAKKAPPPPPAPPEFEKGISDKILEQFGDKVESTFIKPGRIGIKAGRDDVHSVAEFIRDEMSYDHVESVSGVDYAADGEIEVVYHIGSYTDDSLENQIIALSTRAQREDDPIPGGDATRLPTLRDVFYSVEFHEREIFEMFGVYFEGHPDNRRLLLPEDWADLPPLRKDFAIKGR